MNFGKKKVDQSKFLRFFVVALSFYTKVYYIQNIKEQPPLYSVFFSSLLYNVFVLTELITINFESRVVLKFSVSRLMLPLGFILS